MQFLETFLPSSTIRFNIKEWKKLLKKHIQLLTKGNGSFANNLPQKQNVVKQNVVRNIVQSNQMGTTEL